MVELYKILTEKAHKRNNILKNKKVIMFLLFIFFITNLNAQKHEWWGTYFGHNNTINNIKKINDGNFIIFGTCEINNIPTKDSVYIQNKPFDNKDFFISKVTPNCEVLWTTYEGLDINDSGHAIIDLNGNTYIVQRLSKSGKATENALQKESAGGTDLFISKINANGITEWKTFLGGSNNETLNWNLHLKGKNLLIIGRTSSLDFPVTDNAWKDDFYENNNSGRANCFITEITPDCKLAYSSYFGGSYNDIPYNTYLINNELYIYGKFKSDDFPFTQTELDTNNDNFFVKFNEQNELVYAVQPKFGQELRNIDTEYYSYNYDLIKKESKLYNVNISTGLIKDTLIFKYKLPFSRIRQNENTFLFQSSVNSSNVNHFLPISDFAFQKTFYGGKETDLYLMITNNKFEVLYSTYFGDKYSEYLSEIFLSDEGDITFFGYSKSSKLPTKNGLDMKKKSDEYTSGFIFHFKNPLDIINSVVKNSQNDIKLYPLPARGYVRIKTEKIVSTKVFDFTGKILVETKSKYIDISKISSGIYFALIIDENGIEYRKLLIKE